MHDILLFFCRVGEKGVLCIYRASEENVDVPLFPGIVTVPLKMQNVQYLKGFARYSYLPSIRPLNLTLTQPLPQLHRCVYVVGEKGVHRNNNDISSNSDWAQKKISAFKVKLT